ncbi:aminopeptidase [Clostridia bacterium]|nr:aminopeptidase [Clostridia bacterium]
MTGIRKVKEALITESQAALVTTEMNRQYLTGFHSSDGFVVITKEKNFFLVDARYYEHAALAAADFKVVLLKNVSEQLPPILSKYGIETILIENDGVSVAKFEDYKRKYPQYEFDATSWLSDTLRNARMVKSESELKKIETAQRITERAFLKIVPRIKAGMTEKQLAAIVTYCLLEAGSDGLAFPAIVASGKNGAVPHAVPTNKMIEEGEFVTLDFGAKHDGYCSDMTRTVCVGKPSDAMRKVYDAVYSANIDAIKSVHDLVTGKLVDNVARSTVEVWGYDGYFTHGLGHGVGLDIHEQPTLSPASDSTLHKGMVFTIEPGVYIPNRFGVRIEDMVTINDSGCAVLTKTSKKLIIL